MPPPPHQPWKFGQDLGLSVLSSQEFPPPPQKMEICVETNRSIPHGYRLGL